ncbi:tyrosine recombinase XerC [Methylobacterium sp. HMF5984]|uniref:site-specific integrase n=1 Tax=Methylobacterium sp. HMF5984 TaxID=3367370 RepID=UPI0038547917
MIRKKADYLYQRPGSQNWWLRLQYPVAMGRQKVQKSLGTADRHEAEIIALPMVQQHKRDLYLHSRNPNLRGMAKVTSISTKYPIGLSKLDDGTEVIATPIEAIMIRDGVVVGREDNFILNAFDQIRTFDPDAREPKAAKAKPVDNADSAILETYLSLKTRNPYFNKEARDTWTLFKQLVHGKAITDCSRDDARLLVAHLQAKRDKRATIVKKLNYLGAPVNYAIKENKLRFNPFSSVAPEDDDSEKRVPFTDSDMALVAAALPTMKDREAALLWVLLATTGMRLGEAFQIKGEESEKGIRKVFVGTKSKQSKRWVPIPDLVMPYLPAKIEGPLFTSNAKNLGRVLHRVIEKVGVKDKGKVLHSLRHRAKDQLRAEGCPLHVQYELIGHEIKTVAAGYGHGSSMRVLKPWIDKISLTGAPPVNPEDQSE